MLETTVFLLNIIDSNSLHGPVRELHQDNGISNQSINFWHEGGMLELRRDSPQNIRVAEINRPRGRIMY
jgi:hypothetical protein